MLFIIKLACICGTNCMRLYREWIFNFLLPTFERAGAINIDNNMCDCDRVLYYIWHIIFSYFVVGKTESNILDTTPGLAHIILGRPALHKWWTFRDTPLARLQHVDAADKVCTATGSRHVRVPGEWERECIALQLHIFYACNAVEMN